MSNVIKFPQQVSQEDFNLCYDLIMSFCKLKEPANKKLLVQTGEMLVTNESFDDSGPFTIEIRVD